MIENRVQEFREKLGLSQEQLAIKSGIGRSTISEIESNRHEASLRAALRLAKALGTKVEILFSIEE